MLPVIAMSTTPRRLIAGRIGADLVALAGVGDREHDVARCDHAEVAVARLGRVDEQRRRAGRRQGGRDLAADVAALAHAHHDDAAAAGEDRTERGDETFALTLLQRISARASMSSVARARPSARSASKGVEADTVAMDRSSRIGRF